MAAARAADADFARGVDRGPLQGIPLGIKDLLATRDAPTTANSRVLDPAWGQRADATVVRKLREAGAVLMGKTVLHEFAIGWPDPATGFPIARNPWDPARTPGGSSSGTGTAVCAGLVLGGLGSDTGGSIRGPASYCGISGMKPTFGRVSKEGAVPLGYSLDNCRPAGVHRAGLRDHLRCHRRIRSRRSLHGQYPRALNDGGAGWHTRRDYVSASRAITSSARRSWTPR